MNITIITKNDCEPCETVKDILKKEGYVYATIQYEEWKREVGEFMRLNDIHHFPIILESGEYLGSGIMAVHKIEPDINLAKYFQKER